MLHDLFFCILALDDSVRQNINKYIRKEMKKQKIPGLSLAIIQNNHLVYGEGYGYANMEHKVPVKLETMFQSGSMGKQFTAMAIMILVEREEIDLDTPIIFAHILTLAPPDHSGHCILEETFLCKVANSFLLIIF